MTGRNDDGTIRFSIDPRLQGGGERMKAPDPGVPAKPDMSFRIMGQISSSPTQDRNLGQTLKSSPEPELSDISLPVLSGIPRDRRLSCSRPDVRQQTEK